MIGKETENQNVSITDEFREASTRHTLSKFEHDLYSEEDDVVMPIIRVKYFDKPKGKERWKIFSGEQQIFLVDGSKLLKKEKEFLRSIAGINFLIATYKSGKIKSFNALKIAIKAELKRIKEA